MLYERICFILSFCFFYLFIYFIFLQIFEELSWIIIWSYLYLGKVSWEPHLLMLLLQQIFSVVVVIFKNKWNQAGPRLGCDHKGKWRRKDRRRLQTRLRMTFRWQDEEVLPWDWQEAWEVGGGSGEAHFSVKPRKGEVSSRHAHQSWIPTPKRRAENAHEIRPFKMSEI